MYIRTCMYISTIKMNDCLPGLVPLDHMNHLFPRILTDLLTFAHHCIQLPVYIIKITKVYIGPYITVFK